MCETKVILKDKGKEEEIMSEAARIEIDKGKIVISDIMGNSKVINAELESIDLIKHEAILRKMDLDKKRIIH